MRKGFTLIELMLYIGLMAIFIGVLTDVFVATLDVKKESEATSSVEQDGRFILSRLMYDTGRAQAVTSPASLGATGTTLGLVIGGTDATYSLTGENLLLNGNALNSSETKVTSLNFRRLGNVAGKASIQVTLTLESKTVRPKGPEIRSYETSLTLR